MVRVSKITKRDGRIVSFDENKIAVLSKGCITLNTKAVMDIPKGMVKGAFIGRMHAKAPKEAWFSLGVIRWIDYRNLTTFRNPCVDSPLGVRLLKSRRKVVWLDDVVAVHFRHESSNIKGMSQHWWTVAHEPI